MICSAFPLLKNVIYKRNIKFLGQKSNFGNPGSWGVSNSGLWDDVGQSWGSCTDSHLSKCVSKGSKSSWTRLESAKLDPTRDAQ